MYHPDLRAIGVADEHAAKAHYIATGRREGRLYRRVRVLLRYTACTGLINQHYSHIAAFSLAAVLGAESLLTGSMAVVRVGKKNYHLLRFE